MTSYGLCRQPTVLRHDATGILMFLALAIGSTVAPAVRAAPLASAEWTITDGGGNSLAKVADNDPDTVEIVIGDGLDPLSILIDLRHPYLIHRLSLHGGGCDAEDGLPVAAVGVPRSEAAPPASATYPRAFSISVGNVRDATRRVVTIPVPKPSPRQDAEFARSGRLRFDIDARIEPTLGRYVRLKVDGESEGLSWAVAETEIRGFLNTEGAALRDAVVLPAKATPPTSIAAEDLSYYLSELSGRPVPVIDPSRESSYPGNLYCLELLDGGKSWHERLERERNGSLPSTPINVIREGNRITFRACSSKELVQSAWEFLERQGVRWLYPNPQGDFVPAGKGIELTVLPIHYTPSARWIYANFNTREIKGVLPSRDGDLFFWRNRFDSTWGFVLGGDGPTYSQYVVNSWNVKAPTDVPDDYIEGFQGFPHNFMSALPGKVFNQHRPWKAMKLDPRWAEQWKGTKMSALALGQRWSWEGCFSNPEIADFFFNKIKAVIGTDTSRHEIIWLLPNDCVTGCECEECMRLNAAGLGCEKLEWPADHPGAFQASGSFYRMIYDLAMRLQPALPNVKVGILPYGFVSACPQNIARFPDNVVADLCLGQYRGRNLPVASRVNAPLRQRVEEWQAKIAPGNLLHYDYVLLCGKDDKTPIPMVAGIVDRAKYYYAHGLQEGGTEGSTANIVYNPWNFYVYPRMYWNVNQTAGQLLDEFFRGYFREAAEPMLAYYRVMEEFQTKDDVSSSYKGMDLAGAFSFDVLREMGRHLTRAEAAAKAWVVKRRVATVREGYEYVLGQLTLKGQDLENPGFPTVDAEPLTIPGNRLRKYWGYGEAQGDCFRFDAQGGVLAYLNFKSPGRYRLLLSASSNGYEDIWPLVRVRADGRELGQIAVKSKEPSQYELMAAISSGFRALTLNAATGGARVLVVEELSIARLKDEDLVRPVEK